MKVKELQLKLEQLQRQGFADAIVKFSVFEAHHQIVDIDDEFDVERVFTKAVMPTKQNESGLAVIFHTKGEIL